MKKNQSGFTLIELVVVMVLLGILAATALPRYLDLTEEAEEAAVKGVAGGMSSAMALNYAACSVSSGSADCSTVNDCDDATGLLVDAPTGYTITAQAISSGSSATCVVTSNSGQTANFVGIGAP